MQVFIRIYVVFFWRFVKKKPVLLELPNLLYVSCLRVRQAAFLDWLLVFGLQIMAKNLRICDICGIFAY